MVLCTSTWNAKAERIYPSFIDTNMNKPPHTMRNEATKIATHKLKNSYVVYFPALHTMAHYHFILSSMSRASPLSMASIQFTVKCSFSDMPSRITIKRTVNRENNNGFIRHYHICGIYVMVVDGGMALNYTAAHRQSFILSLHTLSDQLNGVL